MHGRPVAERVARDGECHLAYVQFAQPRFRERPRERNIAQAEVVGLLDEYVGRAPVVAVAPVRIVGRETGVARVVARLRPAFLHFVRQVVVAVAHRRLEIAHLHVVAHRMSQGIVHVDVQRPVPVTERIADAACRVGQGIPQQELVFGVDDLPAVHARRSRTVFPLVVADVLAPGYLPPVAAPVAARLRVVPGRVGLLLRLDDALCDIAEDTPHALALGDAPELAPITDRDAVDAVAGIAVVGQFEHAVHVVAVRKIRPPRKTLAVDVDRRQRQLRAVEPDAPQVGRNRVVARRIGEADVEQQVARLLVVIVERQRDAVVQQPEVDAGVELEGLLPD